MVVAADEDGEPPLLDGRDLDVRDLAMLAEDIES
jgi:hypothetical protein